MLDTPKSARQPPPLRAEPSYSFHFSLYTPDPDPHPQPAFDHIFHPLPDNAIAGRHAEQITHNCSRSRYRLTTASVPIDPRLGPIQIDWADRIPAMAQPTPTPTPTPTRKKRIFVPPQPQISTPVARFQKLDSFKVDDANPNPNPNPNPNRASKGERFHGMHLGVAQVSFGIVHLYRDNQEATAASPSTDQPAPASAQPVENLLSDADFGSTLAVLAVPSFMTASDFLSFVEPAAEAICHLRMIRDIQPNRCMVLIQFRDSSDAEDFHKLYHGQPFNAMDPDQICQVVYVTSVTVSKHSSLPLTYPTLSNADPWPLKPAKQASSSSSSSSYELPTCPVCLERMDSSVTGLMTITCQHTFHCTCLSKWSQARCPVCRYSRRADDDQQEQEQEHETEPSTCAICQTGHDLWVCLICASVGCGRYKAGHAHRHFQETGHLYSLELETQRVWDYAGDGYVHRLIQNKADGKLVELPSASSAAATPERSRRLPELSAGSGGSTQTLDALRGQTGTGTGTGTGGDEWATGANNQGVGGSASSSALANSEKIEAIGLEYSYLLTSQLESQRHFYEEKLDDTRRQLTQLTSRVSELDATRAQLSETSARLETLQRDKEQVERERAKAEKRADKMMELARRFEREMQSERSMAQGMLHKLDKQRHDEAALRSQVAELRDQVKDLMFFLEARNTVENEGGAEMRGGDIQVAPPTSTSKKKNKNKNKKGS